MRTTAYKKSQCRGTAHNKGKVNIMLPQILRRRDIEKQFGLSRSTIYEMMSNGTFPKPAKLGPRAVGWREEDLQNWFDNMQETK